MESIIWIWVGLLIVLVIFELATTSLTTIWFAGGSLIALILAILDVELWIQIAAFVVVSLILLIFTRPLFTRLMKNVNTKTNVDSLAGQIVRVTEEVNNLKETGTVYVNGLEWMARSQDPTVVIPVDTSVVIEEVSGVKLIVKPEE